MRRRQSPRKYTRLPKGGGTDGEPMWFIFGNPTRSNGALHSACFGADPKYWDSRCIDSRECKFSNKGVIAEWLEKYGEDPDWFRVRVRGLPPRGSDAHFVDSERVTGAQRRHVSVLPDEPLVMGIDLARGGDDVSVLRFRRGLGARSIPPVVEQCRARSLCSHLRSRAESAQLPLPAGLMQRYGLRVAVHRPSARPSTFMRPPAASPSIHPAIVATAIPPSPRGVLGQSAWKPSSM